MNAAYLEIAGLTYEQADGARWINSVHPDERGPVRARWLDAVQTAQPFHAEVRMRQSDGGTVWVTLLASTARDETGSSAILLLVENIIERKAAESVLCRAEEELFAE